MINWEKCIPYFNLFEYECQFYTIGPRGRVGSVIYEFYDGDLMIAKSQISYNFDYELYGIDLIWVHENYRGKDIGRRMAAAYYDVAVFAGMVTENIKTSTTISSDGPGSEPWLNCIGPQVNLLDPNDPYVVWQKEYRASQS